MGVRKRSLPVDESNIPTSNVSFCSCRNAKEVPSGDHWREEFHDLLGNDSSKGERHEHHARLGRSLPCSSWRDWCYQATRTSPAYQDSKASRLRTGTFSEHPRSAGLCRCHYLTPTQQPCSSASQGTFHLRRKRREKQKGRFYAPLVGIPREPGWFADPKQWLDNLQARPMS